jgi:hypothetical protein
MLMYCDTAFGVLANRLISEMGLPQAYWQPSYGMTGLIPDIICKPCDPTGRTTSGIISQASIKMNEQITEATFRAMEEQARSPDGMSMFWSGSAVHVDIEEQTIAMILAEVCAATQLADSRFWHSAQQRIRV